MTHIVLVVLAKKKPNKIQKPYKLSYKSNIVRYKTKMDNQITFFEYPIVPVIETALFTPSVGLFCLDHTWEYNVHHVHPGDFENLTESHFTELQSVQQVHPSSVHRFTDVEPSHFLEPSLNGHHLALPSPQVRVHK